MSKEVKAFDLTEKLEKIKNQMVSDYTNYIEKSTRCKKIGSQLISDFKTSFEIKKNEKYTKFMAFDACHGFVVTNESDPKFQFGDLLKASTDTSPSRNKSRGNIANESDISRIRWTGIA